MRKLGIAISFVLIISAQCSIAFAAHPSVVISQSCSKTQIGKTKIVAKKTYVCVKNGKGGIWKLNAGGKSQTTTTTTTAKSEAQYWSDLPNGPWYPSRLGDSCNQAMLKEFVDIKIGMTDALANALDGTYAIGVVTSRRERNYVPTKGGLGVHGGEIEIGVYVICGKAGSQNSPNPAITPGGMSTIYSYGGDSMVIGNARENDVVGYFQDSYGYGWYLNGKPNNWIEIMEAVRKASKRVGG